jgi:hypothetical protein
LAINTTVSGLPLAPLATAEDADGSVQVSISAVPGIVHAFYVQKEFAISVGLHAFLCCANGLGRHSAAVTLERRQVLP